MLFHFPQLLLTLGIQVQGLWAAAALAPSLSSCIRTQPPQPRQTEPPSFSKYPPFS